MEATNLAIQEPDNPPEARLGVTKVSPMLTRVLENYRDLITQAYERSLYRIVITLDAWYRRTYLAKAISDLNPKEAGANSGKLENRTETIRDLLTTTLKLYDGLGNCPELQEQVQEMTYLYEGPRYETVTLEELESIKTAMYNCVNGHPFAIRECGIPIEQARYLECGAPIRGQNHTAVTGVSRAREME
ncbi:uncharacterized protein N7525_004647 [Penicillium rubens]|uniref:uncharacterized protein n=1 Tax=Penicillium rubens TaxID=1108849 RepID=UPI002A5998BB|nr:uncharacterized protein N7525_004647 [Penicillium rubens]KAJ5839459.1 hypothetical protein N7525_004647 [Penicillium rubens]